jgi:rubrerythrin
MDEITKSIFDTAVINEQKAQKMYRELAERSTDKSVKALFLNIADEEYSHQMIFLKRNKEWLSKVNKADLNPMKLMLFVDIGPGRKDIMDTIDFAIAEEQKAIEDYSKIMDCMPFGTAKDALKEIIIQETRHKMLLQKLKLEFDKYHW